MIESEDLGSKVVVRTSTDKAEWEEVVRLTNIDGWNESLADLEVYFKCFPGCLFVALLDGKPVGFTAAAKWSKDFAAGGLSIVNEAYRGRGIGKALWKQRFEYVANVNFGITSVSHRIEPNTRLGFTSLLGKMGMMNGMVDKASLDLPRMADDFMVTAYEESAFDDLVAYDNTIQKICPRAEFLKQWLGREEVNTFVARSGGRIIGYGGIQPTFDGYRLTPLYADNDDTALHLFNALVNSVPEDTPKILIFIVKGGLGEMLAEKLGLDPLLADIGIMVRPVREGFTMSWDRVYGTFGGELTIV